jgi:hypothetical protein
MSLRAAEIHIHFILQEECYRLLLACHHGHKKRTYVPVGCTGNASLIRSYCASVISIHKH